MYIYIVEILNPDGVNISFSMLLILFWHKRNTEQEDCVASVFQMNRSWNSKFRILEEIVHQPLLMLYRNSQRGLTPSLIEVGLLFGIGLPSEES